MRIQRRSTVVLPVGLVVVAAAILIVAWLVGRRPDENVASAPQPDLGGALTVEAPRAPVVGPEPTVKPDEPAAETAPQPGPAPQVARPQMDVPPAPLAPALPMVEPPPLEFGDVEVSVVWRSNRRPAKNILVRVVPNDGRSRAVFQRSGRTGTDGVVRLARAASGSITVWTDRYGTNPSGVVTSGQTLRLSVILREFCNVSGRVVDPGGRGVGDAEIRLVAGSGEPEGDSLIARTDADGDFEIESPHCATVYAQAGDHLPSAPVHIDPCVVGNTVPIALQLGGAGSALLIRVLDAEDNPVSGAAVLLSNLDSSALSGWMIDHGANQYEILAVGPNCFERTDDDGQATFRGLPDSMFRLDVRADGYAARTDEILAGSARPKTRAVKLSRGCVVTGRATFANGQPASGAVICASDARFSDAVSTTTREDGTFWLSGVSSASNILYARSGEWSTHERCPPIREGALRPWNPVLVQRER